MLYTVLATVLIASVFADVESQHYSISPSVGSGGGMPYTLSGEGRITAVRVWERYNSHIYGFQFRYGLIWSTVVGRVSGTPRVMELYAGEAIIQISGKYTSRIFSVIFITNNGRSLSAGQPVGHSFNMYANSSKAELRKVSGRQRGRISSFAAHWAVVDPTFNQNTEH